MKPVRWGILPNGLRFYSHFDRGENVSGVGVCCGSIYDPKNKRYMGHLKEHVLCRNSIKYKGREVDLIFRKYMGGSDDDINIRIDKVSTFFGHDQLLRRCHMLQVFDVMANFMKDLLLDNEGLKIEAAAIHNEHFLRGKDSLPDELLDLLTESMYDINPVRNRIDCVLSELKKADLRSMRRSASRHYVPNNMFVIMFGEPYKKVEQIARNIFGDLETKPDPTLDYDHSEDFPTLSVIKSREEFRSQIGQTHIAIGFPTETYLSPDGATLDVIAKLLEMRLTWRLREDNRDFNGGVYRVPVETERTFVHGMIYVQYATIGQDFALKAEEIVLHEMHRLKEELANKNDRDSFDEELNVIIGSLENPYLTAFQTLPGDLCERVIAAVCNGDKELTHLHSYRERLHKVTRRKIREVANKYFTKNYARACIRPA